MRSLLEILAAGDFVTGEEAARELGITRAAVWKRIDALRAEGWEIRSAGKRGYRLETGDSLRPETWTGRLTTRRLGRGENRWLQETDSTNTQVKRMAMAGAPDGSLCLAAMQTAGRGRLDRRWVSPAGKGLWLTVLLRPRLAPQQAPMITFCAALAMARAVRETTGLSAALKWPNDLVLDGRKVCGILLEMGADPERIEYVAVGTGLNVLPGAYPPELADRAVSLGELQPALPPRREILTAYLAALETAVDRLEGEGAASILADCRARMCTLGQPVRVSGSVSFAGVAEELDEDGALLVRDEDGTLRRVVAGDVSVRGVMGYV